MRFGKYSILKRIIQQILLRVKQHRKAVVIFTVMDSFALILHEAYAIVNCSARFCGWGLFPFPVHNGLRRRAVHAGHAGKGVLVRLTYRFQASEGFQQRLAPGRADSGNILQGGMDGRLPPQRAVMDNAETVRLVPDSLYKLQLRRMLIRDGPPAA